MNMERATTAESSTYVTRIQAMRHPQLLRLWRKIKHGTPIPGWPNGRPLEYLILRAFELEGAVVRWPYTVRFPEEERRTHGYLEQIDGAVHHAGLSALIEAKDLDEDIGFEPIATLQSQLLRRPGGTLAVVFSRRGFTRAARTLARFTMPQAVLLWSGEELELAIEKRKLCEGLCVKHRYAVEEGLLEYNLRLEGW